jgi:hypothetical protein
MKPVVLLAGPDLTRLAEISACFDPMSCALVLAPSGEPVRALVTTAPCDNPVAAVVELTGNENIAELEELLARYPRTAFVLLLDEMPPHAAVVRATARQAAFLDRRESTLTISATLVALMYQRRAEAQPA